MNKLNAIRLASWRWSVAKGGNPRRRNRQREIDHGGKTINRKPRCSRSYVKLGSNFVKQTAQKIRSNLWQVDYVRTRREVGRKVARSVVLGIRMFEQIKKIVVANRRGRGKLGEKTVFPSYFVTRNFVVTLR